MCRSTARDNQTIREEEEEVKNEMGRDEGDGGVAAADRDVSRTVIKAKSVCMMMLSFTIFFIFFLKQEQMLAF